MNEVNELAFWIELFTVTIRYEERRNAALSNLKLQSLSFSGCSCI
jgi:hypothetical protein